MRFLLTAVLLSMMPWTAIADDTASGVWYGTMDVGVREFRFRIEPVDAKDAAGEQQLVSLDEGGSAFRLEDFKEDDTSFSFQLKLTKAAYEGTKSNDGKTVSGKWKQSGAEFDLVLQHFDKAPVFQTCTTGGVSEYQQIEETMSPLALEKLTKRILQVTGK